MQKQQLPPPPLPPASLALLWLAALRHLHRDAGWEQHTGSCDACSSVLNKGTSVWQSIRAWRTPWQTKSAACCKAATLEWLCPPSLLQQVIPFGSSAALVRQHYCCLFWPGEFVSSLQPTHTPVPRQATRVAWESAWHAYTGGQPAVRAG